MHNCLFSIIIPHYNIPDLLMRCLGSIPIREDIQVIVIDDCSPNSEDYIERYPELSRPYLEFYRTPQGGSAGRARNIGLDKACGKWVICMDADDLFVDNMTEILEESKDRTEDVLFYNYETVLNEDITKPGYRGWYKAFFEEYKRNGKEDDFRYSFCSMWGKIISNEMIQTHHIRCDETRYANDVAFSFKCGVYAKSIAVIDKPFFLITDREGSLATSELFNNKTKPDEYMIRLCVLYNLAKFVDDNSLNINYKPYLNYAFKFFKDWPKEFWKGLFTVIFPQFPKYALQTLMYITYFKLIKRA